MMLGMQKELALVTGNTTTTATATTATTTGVSVGVSAGGIPSERDFSSTTQVFSVDTTLQGKPSSSSSTSGSGSGSSSSSSSTSGSTTTNSTSGSTSGSSSTTNTPRESTKGHSLGKLSHYLNEMKQELDVATRQRRESNLETQRLREKCVHLEDRLAAASSKNTLLEEVKLNPTQLSLRSFWLI